MAYPAVRSVSSNFTLTNGTSISCTHPSGLTAGDLMVLLVGNYVQGIDTPSGWTLLGVASAAASPSILCWKVATAGDVSAGSTTVTFAADADRRGYAMYAITGAASGSEITEVSVDDKVASGSSTLTVSTSVTPLVSESLVLSFFFTLDFNLSSALTASSFSLTPSITLTKDVDVGVRDGVNDGNSIFAASGQYSGYSEITSRSVTVSESITTTFGSYLVLVNAPQNATASNALFQTTPDTFSPLTGSTQEPNNDFQEIEPQFFSQSGVARSTTTWSSPAKTSTSWTNTPKL